MEIAPDLSGVRDWVGESSSGLAQELEKSPEYPPYSEFCTVSCTYDLSERLASFASNCKWGPHKHARELVVVEEAKEGSQP
jgi:hypothetical protein